MNPSEVVEPFNDSVLCSKGQRHLQNIYEQSSRIKEKMERLQQELVNLRQIMEQNQMLIRSPLESILEVCQKSLGSLFTVYFHHVGVLDAARKVFPDVTSIRNLFSRMKEERSSKNSTTAIWLAEYMNALLLPKVPAPFFLLKLNEHCIFIINRRINMDRCDEAMATLPEGPLKDFARVVYENIEAEDLGNIWNEDLKNCSDLK